MVRLSFSKISDFEQCPRKFWFSYIRKVPIQQNEFMELGKHIHEILYKSTLVDDWEGYLKGLREYVDYKVMIDNYIDYQHKLIKAGGNPKPEFAEVKFHDIDYDFSLVIDRIDKKDEKTLLTDYKTDGKPEQDKHDKQLLIYSYFYNKNFPETPITHYGPLFVKKQKTIKAKELTPEKMKEAMNWLSNNKADIELRGTDHLNFPAVPNRFCTYCSHRMSGYCKEGNKYIMESADTATELEEKECNGLKHIPEKSDTQQN